jgi:hypothetical protein
MPPQSAIPPQHMKNHKLQPVVIPTQILFSLFSPFHQFTKLCED